MILKKNLGGKGARPPGPPGSAGGIYMLVCVYACACAHGVVLFVYIFFTYPDNPLGTEWVQQEVEKVGGRQGLEELHTDHWSQVHPKWPSLCHLHNLNWLRKTFVSSSRWWCTA